MEKPAATEARRFSVDPHVIMSLIKAQAGSLEKAMLEAVANSMDAGASRIDVAVSDRRVEIRDNGTGLASAEDIYRFFEVFGFDHSQLDRKVGRFGVGRGQLFCYGVNRWRTNSFEMVIDIKNRGLDYDLKKGLSPHPGMSIIIDLDESLPMSRQLRIEEEFRKLVRYAAVPVFFNGQRISEDPADSKWSHETEDAWFSVRKDGRVSVYSQGLFVCELNGSEFGVGGKIVTKAGRALAQNLARNDLLVKECGVWNRVRPVMSTLAKPFRDQARSDAYLSPDMRKRMAIEALTPSGGATLHTAKLFTLSNNRHVGMLQLLDAGFVFQATTFDRAADKLMQRKQAVALDPSTLERFGVDTVEELRQRLEAALLSHIAVRPDHSPKATQGVYRYYIEERLRKFQATRFVERAEDLPFDADVSFTPVPYRQLNPEEKAVVFALRKQMGPLSYVVWKHRHPNEAWSRASDNSRQLSVFEDNGAMEACTDGHTNVWLNRKTMVQKARQGMSGFVELMCVLLHEQLHGDSSELSHGHPPEFYEDFHNLLLDGNLSRFALSAYANYFKHGPKPTAKRLSELEKLGVEIDTPVGLGTALAEEMGTVPAANAPAPVKRKRRQP